ncbi:DUF6912 family protein [Candidatus Planktophila dulcis]|jgi:hypothetical protein|uniref:DUF6912 family protein n=1 Tax=Candidatus Planktophila dulcis TaxID=1884914 RepID=UPI003BEF2EC0
MRGYVAMTAQEVAEFMASGLFDVSDVYAPTSQFIVDHQDLDDEEIEYTLSMVAAEDALEMKTATTGAACVLAFEVPAESISESHDMSISLSSPLKWESLECLFEVSSDGEELTWYATQEIDANLASWLK